MTVTSNALFNTLLELQCQDSVGEEAAQSVEEKVKNTLPGLTALFLVSIFNQFSTKSIQIIITLLMKLVLTSGEKYA